MASIRLEKLLICDEEFSCQQDPFWTKENGELIEIAIVPLDLKTLEIRHDLAWSSLVKPTRTEVNEYCTNLTGITAEMVRKEGKPFSEVCNSIENQFGHGSAWLTWGESDRDVLLRASEYAGVRYPMAKTHINGKHLYSVLRGRRRELGFKKALQAEGIQFEGTPHRAMSDAKNLAVLWQKLLSEIRGLERNNR